MTRSSALAALWVGCTGGGSPRDGRLEGIWVSTDLGEGVHRGLEITELDAPVGGVGLQYTLYRYPIDDAPEPVQSGLFSVVDDEVLWDVRWDVDPFRVGVRYADPLVSLSRDELVIGTRTWLAADVLIPGDTTPPVFGEAWWGLEVPAGLGTGLWVDEAGIVAGTSGLTGDRVSFVGIDGDGPPTARLDRAQSGQLGRVAGVDGDVVYSEGSLTARMRPVLVPGDAFVPDRTELEVVWAVADLPCAGLVTAGPRLAGMCTVGPSHGLAWLDPETGEVSRRDVMVPSVLGELLWPLGDDVLVARLGPSPTPDVHGDRSAEGSLIERRAADGTVRWSRWSPGPPRVEDATLLDDGTVVIALTAEGELPGGPTWPQGGAVLQGVGPTGELRWERTLPLASNAVALAPTPGGFAMALGADDVDVGGSVGRIVAPRGQALAVVAMDACGQAVDVATWQDCTETCWGQVTPSPQALAHGLRRAPDGSLVLSASLVGRFDLDGDLVGVSGDGVGLIARLAPPPVAPVCDPPGASDPILTITVSGPGEVDLPGIGTCDGTCTFAVERFAAVEVLPAPSPGAQVDAVQGACAVLPCTVYADRASASLEVSFAVPDATLFGVDGHVRAVGAGATLGFAAGQLGPGEQALVDGVQVADGDAGDRAWIAALDAQGLVAHAALPGTPTGPYPRRMAVDPGSDTAAVLFASGEIATFGPSGLLTNGPGPAGGQWERIGIDGLGNVAVAGYSGSALVVSAADGAWSQTMPTGIPPIPVAVLGLPAGGFVVVTPAGASLEATPGTVWSGNAWSLAVVHLAPDGAVIGGGFTSTVTSLAYARAWTDGASVFVGADYTQDASQPVAGAYVERLAFDGTFLDARPVSHAPLGVWPWSGGLVAADQTFGTSNPWGGPPLDNRGGLDRAVAWLDGSGALITASTTGTAADDGFDGLFDPVAVQSDGVVWLHTPADAVVTTPFALARFSPP